MILKENLKTWRFWMKFCSFLGDFWTFILLETSEKTHSQEVTINHFNLCFMSVCSHFSHITKPRGSRNHSSVSQSLLWSLRRKLWRSVVKIRPYQTTFLLNSDWTSTDRHNEVREKTKITQQVSHRPETQFYLEADSTLCLQWSLMITTCSQQVRTVWELWGEGGAASSVCEVYSG